MPLNKSCSLDALRENIAAEIRAGKPRDQAVAVAHSVLRSACSEEGKPTPTAKDVAGVARDFRRPKGERTVDYLEEALAAARRALPHRDFAVIHQVARSRAGGMASARARFTPVEKSLLLGPDRLTAQELWDALARADEMAAADMRRNLDLGAAALSQMLEREYTRRELMAKDDPGAGDVHVATTAQGKPKKRKPAIPAERTLKADRTDDPGVMVAFRLPEATAAAIALDGGEPSERLHVTLAYLGRMSELGPDGLVRAKMAMQEAAYECPVLKGVLCGIGRFAGTDSSDGKDVVFAPVDAPGLTDFRRRVVECLELNGVPIRKNHDYTPHVTLAYVDPSASTPRLKDSLRLRDVYFDKVVLSVNDADTAYPLGGADALRDARLAALAAQARDMGEESALPSAPVVMAERHDETGATAMSADGMCYKASVKADFDFEPGDIVELAADMFGNLVIEGPSACVLPADSERVSELLEKSQDARRHGTLVPFAGPEAARLVFVAGAPSELELARGEPMVGANGIVFSERYLAPLGVTKSEVAVGFACPVLPRVADDEISSAETGPWSEYVAKELDRWPGAIVVALGLPAREALGERANYWLPHPTAARLNEDRYDGQVTRKLRQVAKSLDGALAIAESEQHQGARPDGTTPEILTGRVGETLAAGPSTALMRVAKAADEKQIVYGVVLDPYEIDTQNEWVPPATIEASAHDYVKKSRVIGREHRKPANAELVESWVVPYPSQSDYEAALANLPHKAYEMPYGSDTVHSGAWIIGVQLGDAEWRDYRDKKITGFSIGGFSAKTRVNKNAMPKVEFVPLAAAK